MTFLSMLMMVELGCAVALRQWFGGAGRAASLKGSGVAASRQSWQGGIWLLLPSVHRAGV